LEKKSIQQSQQHEDEGETQLDKIVNTTRQNSDSRRAVEKKTKGERKGKGKREGSRKREK